jgi:hypothetical protein
MWSTRSARTTGCLSAERGGRLLAIRRARNRAAAGGALFGRSAYDAVVIEWQHSRRHRVPDNASLGLPTVTFEFGDKGRAWVCGDQGAPGNGRSHGRRHSAAHIGQRRQMSLIRAQRRVSGRFGRLWQRANDKGAERPARSPGWTGRQVLLARTSSDNRRSTARIFTGSMAGGSTRLPVPRSARDIQTVVRIHPGELLGIRMPSGRSFGRAPEVHITSC